MADLVELNEHYGLTPANIVSVDYRRKDEATITYIDPHGGLQTMLLADTKGKVTMPPHFSPDNKLGVDFNFDLIAGFVKAGNQPDFCEVHIKGAAGRIVQQFDVQGLRAIDIAQSYKDVVGHIPKILYRNINRESVAIVTPLAVDAAQFAQSVMALRGRAGRPTFEKDAPQPDGLIR